MYTTAEGEEGGPTGCACEMTPFVTDIEARSELSTCINAIMHNLLKSSRSELNVTMMNTVQVVDQIHNSRETGTSQQ